MNIPIKVFHAVKSWRELLEDVSCALTVYENNAILNMNSVIFSFCSVMVLLYISIYIVLLQEKFLIMW